MNAGAPAYDRFDVDVRRPWLAARAARDAERLALVTSDRRFTFGELDRRARRLAGTLVARGLRPGARVAALTEVGAAFVVLVHACQRAGLVLAPLNTRLTAAELVPQLARLAPALLVHDAASRALARATAARFDGSGAAGDSAAPRISATLELGPEPGELGDVGDGGDGGRADHDHGGCADHDDVRDTVEASVDPGAVMTVVFTSGTAAAPKGVMLSAANHVASARAALANLRIGRNARWLVPLPLYHVGGLSVLYRSVLAGFAVVLGPAIRLRSAGAQAQGAHPTVASLVPTMLASVLDEHPASSVAGGEDARAERCIVVLGGGPCGADLVERAAAAGFDVVTSYGMTETASQVTATSPGAYPGAALSAGEPLREVEVRIARNPDVEPTGGAQSQGVGEILVRAPQVMLGYLGDEAASVRAVVGGWLHTGDLGRLDELGRLHIATRRDDLIVTGGENVVPEEVEAILCEHPHVDEAAVFGRDDARWGQAVAAAVVAAPATSVDAADLRGWCRERLAGYKVPRSFEVVIALPRTAGGKVMRRTLAERSDRRVR